MPKDPFADNVYYFNASAVAVATRYRRPFDASEELGSVLVSSPGGDFTKEAKILVKSLAKHAVSVKSFKARAYGDFTNRKSVLALTNSQGSAPNRWCDNQLPITTGASCLIEDLVVVNRDRTTRKRGRTLRIESFEFKIDSTHDRAPKSELKTKITAGFARVFIDDTELRIGVDTKAINSLPTHSDLVKANLGDRKHPRSHDQCAVATVVNKITWVGKELDDVDINGHTVFVPGFGTIYFGEVVSGWNQRRILMVRIALGSPDGAELLSGGGGSDGHGIP